MKKVPEDAASREERGGWVWLMMRSRRMIQIMSVMRDKKSWEDGGSEMISCDLIYDLINFGMGPIELSVFAHNLTVVTIVRGTMMPVT
jgi:hypothetical protein